MPSLHRPDTPTDQTTANEEPVPHLTGDRQVTVPGATTRTRVSTAGDKNRFPEYAHGTSNHKVVSRQILEVGRPALLSCRQCLEQRIACIVSESHRSCAYCTSRFHIYADGCTAVRGAADIPKAHERYGVSNSDQTVRY